MHAYYSLPTSVEEWVDQIIRENGQTIIVPDELNSLPAAESVSTPRPSNKRQRQASGEFSTQNAETTPRPLFPYASQSRGSGRGPYASTSTTTTTTTETSRSGWSSPRKREAALRSAPTWPVIRSNLADLKALPDMIESLALDLRDIADGKQPLIPHMFQDSMTAQAGILTRPRPEWFYTANDDREDLVASHRQMNKIHQNSLKCKARMDHEPAWNDLVHSRVLEEALEGVAGVDFRNITHCRTLKSYQDNDTTLRDNKVNYGIFLEPARRSDGLAERLATLASMGIDITHFHLSDFANTPLAVSIETKGLGAEPLEGDAQLANWVRAHFRHLARVVESCAPDHPLPVLPIVYVAAGAWRVDFAHRCEGQTVIYEGITVGNTLNLYGCYQVRAALRRLAIWVRDDFKKWWLEVATLPA